MSPLTTQLMRLSCRDDCSLVDIVNLIEKDASLTIRILKLANSAFFGSSYPATTVRDAVFRMGMQQIRLLALSLSLRDTFPLEKIGAADYRYFWRLSLYQGLIARHLAKQEDPEEAFMTAFTLEIGLLVFLHGFLDPSESDIPWYPLSSLLEWESRNYGVNHREIGELLLIHWRFPAKVILCQRSYQIGDSAALLPPLARLCAIASCLSAFICRSQSYLPDVLAIMQQIFNLDLLTVANVVTIALSEVDSISEMFDLDIDSDEDKLQVMTKAREAFALFSEQMREGQQCLPDLPGDSPIEHEMRNRLILVGAFARRLAKTIKPNSEQAEYIRIILSETAKLDRMLTRTGGESS